MGILEWDLESTLPGVLSLPPRQLSKVVDPGEYINEKGMLLLQWIFLCSSEIFEKDRFSWMNKHWSYLHLSSEGLIINQYS